jgi:ATP-dependent 26S proteasome regulatory subunit
MEIQRELSVHFRAKYSVIVLESHEETRAINIITAAAMDVQFKRKVYVGSITKGLQDVEDSNPKENMSDPLALLTDIETRQKESQAEPAIYVLLDFHPYMENPAVRRKIRDLHSQLKLKKSSLVFVSPQFPVPPDLQKVVTVFDLPLPNAQELEEILCNRIKGLKNQEKKMIEDIESKPDQAEAIKKQLKRLQPITQGLIKQADENKDAIIGALQGLTSVEADNVVAKALVLHDLSIPTILGEKKQIIKKSGVLEYFETASTLDDIGGLKLLKAWSRSVKNRFTAKARQYGLTPPRGVLLVGAPGTGKSLSAKALSNLLNLPLLRLDMAGMASKFYGETGNRMKEALKLAKALAPCILWIDEIDKALGTGQGSEHEESARTRGTLLTEMEEAEGIFWLATCNQPTALAPELAARFPKSFHVDLPNANERREIMAIHLAKVKRDYKKFDLDQLVSISEGFVGREIRNVVQEALSQAFDQDTELATSHLVDQFKKAVPTYLQRKEDIDRIRKWAKQNASEASEPQTATYQSPTVTPAKSITTDEVLNSDLEVD